jgi:Barrel-sandwich domain of CusB or HlyD membrane-fusion
MRGIRLRTLPSLRSGGYPAPSPTRPGRRLPAMKRFMARYIYYLEIFGYTAVSLVALAVIGCFFFQVDDLIRPEKEVPIAPRMESIHRDADALVTRVFVRNHQQVRRGDPLVEVVESPPWMSRFLVMRRMRTLVDELAAPGQSAELAEKRAEAARGQTKDEEDAPQPSLPAITLTPDEEKLQVLAAQRVAEWETHAAAKAPRSVIRSPIDGVAIVLDDLEVKRIDAGAEILKVADLDDLRLNAKFLGETVADARTGQEVNIKAIVPNYKTGLVFRGDTVPRGRPFWQKERITSYRVLDPKLKEIVKDAFKHRTITQRDDIPFHVTDVTGLEIDADVDTAARGSEPTFSADAPAELTLTGKVVEGKHRVTVQVADIPPAVVKQVTQQVAEQLRGKVFDVPGQPARDGGPVPLHALRVEALQDAQIIAKVKGENTRPHGPTARLKDEAARSAVRGASLEKERVFEATVRIENPPQFLKDRVLELLENGQEVKARMELRTGRRPVAFLLLKR